MLLRRRCGVIVIVIGRFGCGSRDTLTESGCVLDRRVVCNENGKASDCGWCSGQCVFGTNVRPCNVACGNNRVSIIVIDNVGSFLVSLYYLHIPFDVCRLHQIFSVYIVHSSEMPSGLWVQTAGPLHRTLLWVGVLRWPAHLKILIFLNSTCILKSNIPPENHFNLLFIQIELQIQNPCLSCLLWLN